MTDDNHSHPTSTDESINSSIKFEDKEPLQYHSMPCPGKITIKCTKPMNNQHDLALAYSPGVAIPCLEIKQKPETAYQLTNKGNMVAVISNGSAVLGLGNLGALAAKPVMEGKAVLFNKFAGVESVDLCIDAKTPEEIVNCVKCLGPSFAGINLEDIKAPDCFLVEESLKKIMDIPVYHDDQHGTAIVTLAGFINAIHLTKRDVKSTKVVLNGAGAAGIATIKLIHNFGVPKENIICCDTLGVIYKGRKDGMNPWKLEFANNTQCRSLKEALIGADCFVGVSGPNLINRADVAKMAKNPIIFAMANPIPEIDPKEARAGCPGAIIATGRSDFPNQILNTMAFPFLFRGAIDVRAKEINEQMKVAAAEALASLAREPVPFAVRSAYAGRTFDFGVDYVIPTPFDPRLLERVSIAVAKAAMESGAARIQIDDWEKYKFELQMRIYKTSY